MKKKLFSLMMLCLLAFTGAYAQWVEVTGSSVYTNYQLPSNFFYNYSLTQQIYTADELADVNGEIRAISYYNSSSTSTNIYTRHMDVYMVLTEKNAFESETDWVAVTEADKVFSGEVVSAAIRDWVTIYLDTPFAYDGTKNLIVVFDDNSGNYVSSTVTSRCFQTPGVTQALYIRNNDTNYNPLTITDAGSLYGYKNVMKFLSYPEGAVFSENLPTNSYYKYSLTQQIYTPADVDSINTDITGISFFNVGPEQTRNLDIYFVAVGDETMTEWAAVDSSNLVFSGEVTFASNDWTQIPTKRFLNFDGTYNLAVLVDDNTDVGMAGLQFLMMEEQVANSALYYHSDDTTRLNPDPLNLAGIVGTSEAIRPAVQFAFKPAGYVEIGSGTTGYGVLPFRNQSAYSVSQQIYTAQEIGLAGSLLEIQLYAFTNATTRDIEIYLSHTDANEVAAAWLPVSTSHLVYSGSTTFAVGTWNTITLNTPFEYNGEQNIVMTVVDKTGTAVENAQRTNFLTTATTNNQAHYAYGSNPYDALNLAGVSGYVMTNKNQIHMQFRVGDIPEAPKDLYVLDMTDTTFVDTLFLGDRPNNAWMRPMDIYSLWNHTGRAINISRFDFTPEDGFFAVIDPETPVQMAAEDTIPMLFTTNITDTTFVDTTIMRQFVVIYDGARTAGVWPIAVHAYNPVCPDVFELAQFLDTIPALAADSVLTYGPFEFTGDPDTIYDNYQLPYSDEPFLLADGKDVVYKFTVLPGQEVLLNASVTGENGKVAVYTEDFYGEPGPMPHNFYAGPQMLVAGAREDRAEFVNDPNAECCPEPTGNTVCTRDAWDMLFSFQGTSAGQQAIATDGSSFYTASWQGTPTGGYTFYKYNINGTFVEGFNIAGATGIRDLTYDGQYFYGSSGGNKIFILDFTNRTLVGTITCAGLTSRHVSYDPVRDGFWSGDWSTLALYNRSGALVQTAPALSGAYGSAYYKDEEGGEHIYLFCQTGTSKAQVFDYNIAANTIDPSPIADINSIPGQVVGTSSAGGAFIGNYNGKVCFFCNVQATPNAIGIFELKDVPAPTGYLTYWEPNPVIEGLTMAAGTYYLVGSATSPDFTVNIEFVGIPCPEAAVAVSPADDADDVQIGSGINLQWTLGNYTTEYRLVFGSTYYCEEVLVDWTSDLAQSYTVLPSHPLYNNTNYFWRVDTRNGNCETQGEVYGFTTTFNAPTNLRATDNSVFVGEDVVMEWNAIQDRTFRKYNIYLNDSCIGNTTITYLPGTYTSFTIPASLLTYNMDPGYRVNVTAYYDEGESPYSNTYILKVSGNGTLRGHIWEQDGSTGISGATVSVNGFNEFGEPFSTTATSLGNGTYSVNVPATNDTVSYVCTASKAGYQTAYEPIQGNPRPVTYNASTQADFILDEVFAPVPSCAVFAEFYPDPEVEDEYVKVTWTMNGGESVDIDFETNDFSQGTFNN
ncbi:MAG: fibronectin type III domain-containing protein, partial [Bacteroidales bacterium]|nr:fibronectin type III domain-containing protein [Bacteroidales bacterium]